MGKAAGAMAGRRGPRWNNHVIADETRDPQAVIAASQEDRHSEILQQMEQQAFQTNQLRTSLGFSLQRFR